jgi:hypothetical protein
MHRAKEGRGKKGIVVVWRKMGMGCRLIAIDNAFTLTITTMMIVYWIHWIAT